MRLESRFKGTAGSWLMFQVKIKKIVQTRVLTSCKMLSRQGRWWKCEVEAPEPENASQGL